VQSLSDRTVGQNAGEFNAILPREGSVFRNYPFRNPGSNLRSRFRGSFRGAFGLDGRFRVSQQDGGWSKS